MLNILDCFTIENKPLPLAITFRLLVWAIQSDKLFAKV